jgi:hypothetical protein
LRHASQSVGIFDERHPYVAIAAFEAGAMQLQRGQYEHAKILLEQADAILVEHRLITTPAYAVSRMKLAELAFKDRDFAQANELASEGITVAMLSQPMPVGHMHQAYGTLAKCLVEEGRPQAAMQILVKSTRDSSFSHVTPQIQAEVITTLATIGEMLGDTGEAAVARDYIARLQMK